MLTNTCHHPSLKDEKPSIPFLGIGVLFPKLLPAVWGHCFPLWGRGRLKLGTLVSLRKASCSIYYLLSACWESSGLTGVLTGTLWDASRLEIVSDAEFWWNSLETVWSRIKQDIGINIFQHLSILLSILKGESCQGHLDFMGVCQNTNFHK